MSAMKSAYREYQESWVRGHVDHHAAPNLSSNIGELDLGLATKSEMVSNGTHRKRRNLNSQPKVNA
jgi:hypothetical protein